jgi:uncharacterized protein YndB with AHSA1/START domain
MTETDPAATAHPSLSRDASAVAPVPVIGALLAPVRIDLALATGAARAFAVFTAGIGGWWPSAFTASGDRLASVVIEGRVGGRVYEQDVDGAETGWGSVTGYEPGRRLVLAWTLATDQPTEVEVSFADTVRAGNDGADLGPGAGVRLVHRGWRPGQAGERERFAHPEGWARVLGYFQAAAEG